MWRTRVSRSFFIATAATILAGAACSSGTGPSGDLAAARSRWSRLAPTSYTVTVTRSCECLPGAAGLVVVSVRNGVVASRVYAHSGAPVSVEFATLFPGVDGLFELIDEAVRDGTRPLVARYHPTLGYPTRIELGDPAVDAPLYIISGLQPR